MTTPAVPVASIPIGIPALLLTQVPLFSFKGEAMARDLVLKLRSEQSVAGERQSAGIGRLRFR